jgi:hypothetical protein
MSVMGGFVMTKYEKPWFLDGDTQAKDDDTEAKDDGKGGRAYMIT